MNAASLNNLWSYLQGLALTADNWRWLAERMQEQSDYAGNAKPEIRNKGYKLSPKRKKLMERVKINPKDFEGDERAQYILSK